MEQANAAAGAALKADPGNLMAVYLADYEDCIVLLLNCDPAEYDKRAPNMAARIAQLEKGGDVSPWYRLCKAGIYMHRAIVDIRFGAQYKAALNFRRSFSLLKENKELFPAFEYNDIFLGLEEAVVGALPGSYKWLASVLGMKGSVKNGTAHLAAFLATHNSSHPLYSETVLYYLYARFYLLSEQQEVWNFLNSSQFSTQGNLLNAFVKTNIALDYRKSDAAIATLTSSVSKNNFDAYPIFYNQMGMALLTRADTGCVYYLQEYLQKTRSGLYIKDSWQKMALAYYVNNNKTDAQKCLALAATQGNSRLDADKQAKRFAENGVWPLRPLLEARLLTEGGYYERSLAILEEIKEGALANAGDKAEYYYRMGRVQQELAEHGQSKQYFLPALKNYSNAITVGKQRHEQFAARAALQMGKIYEVLGMHKEAMHSYNECLDMPAHDFQNSIDQQAKAGVNRVSEP